MPPRRFPTTLVRDLLGLVRLLYRAEQDVDMPESYGRLGRLEEAGRAFREAITLSKRGGTTGHQTALYWAEKGITILRECVMETRPELEDVVRVAALPFRRPPPPRDD